MLLLLLPFSCLPFRLFRYMNQGLKSQQQSQPHHESSSSMDESGMQD